MPPKVSVICTAKNAASTIDRTIQSILAQDFRDWEMIIVDDGSTDDTAAVASRYARADKRVKLVTTGGIGRGRALNRAMADAEAELVANIDADDESHPARLQLQVATMEGHPQFAVLCTEFIRVYDRDQPVWPTLDGAARVKNVTGALALTNPICHSSAMMRKPAVIALAGYSEGRRFVLDYDLWVRCAAAGLQLGQIEMPLAAKRIHAGQYYLRTARLRYLLASLGVQVRAMRVLGLNVWQLPVIALRLVWLILPLGVRHMVGKLSDRRRTNRGREQ